MSTKYMDKGKPRWIPDWLVKTEYHETGDAGRATGSVIRERIFWPLWVADKVLAQHPHWDWLASVSKNWGNPLCAAYCFAWSNWYHRTEFDHHWFHIPWSEMDPKTQQWLIDDHRKFYDDPTDPYECYAPETCVVHEPVALPPPV